MFRKSKRPQPRGVTINVLVADGGLGDMICTIPALSYLITTQDWINPLIWVPDYMLDLAKHLLPNTVQIKNYTDAKTEFNDKLVGITTQWRAHKTAMRTHPVDYAYQALLDRYPYNNIERSYPRVRADEIDISSLNLPQKYVVIAGTAAEAVKTMPVNTMNSCIEYVRSKGYEVVIIGSEKVFAGVGQEAKIPVSKADFSNCINLINKTNVLQLAGVIDKASLFIGMDGGPTHVAGFTKTPIVAGFTFVSSHHVAPIRDGIVGKDVYPIEPPVELDCRFCQTNWALLYNHDFRSCLYDDYKCVSYMTFDKFKEGIDKFI